MTSELTRGANFYLALRRFAKSRSWVTSSGIGLARCWSEHRGQRLGPSLFGVFAIGHFRVLVANGSLPAWMHAGLNRRRDQPCDKTDRPVDRVSASTFLR